jgi:hypothetical protein
MAQRIWTVSREFFREFIGFQRRTFDLLDKYNDDDNDDGDGTAALVVSIFSVDEWMIYEGTTIDAYVVLYGDGEKSWMR